MRPDRHSRRRTGGHRRGTPPNVSIANAVDSHVHVFCGDEFPFAPERAYTLEPCAAGTACQLAAVLESHGLTHALLVGPQPCGTDNRCTLRSIARSNGRFPGIALVTPQASERELHGLDEAGVVGIWINLSTDGLPGLADPGADALMARVDALGGFVQVHCEHDEPAMALPLLRRAGARLMIDHFARPDLRRGLDRPGFQALLALGRDGEHVFKLSGPFGCSRDGPPYRDVDPFVAATMYAFGPGRCVWGSDWPLVRVTRRVGYGPGARGGAALAARHCRPGAGSPGENPARCSGSSPWKPSRPGGRASFTVAGRGSPSAPRA